MTDPIRIERAFQELINELELVTSIRHRFYLIREFTVLLNGDYKKFESYIIQVVTLLPIYKTPVTYSGLDPERIEGDILLFQKIENSVSDITADPNYLESIKRMKYVCLILYALLGELKKVDDLLLGWFQIDLDLKEDAHRKKNSYRDQSNIQHFEKALDNYLNANSKKKQVISDLKDDLNEFSIERENSLWVPVVEKYGSLFSEEVTYGRLRKLNVEVSNEIKSEADRLVRRFNIIGVEQPHWIGEGVISQASRSLFKKEKHKVDGRHFKGDIQYELTGAVHEGNSANAAISALWYTGLLKFLGLRERFEIKGEVCITGDIDSSSLIQPVDDESVQFKTEAVFFSSVKYLIVPEQQLEIFRGFLIELNQRYPNRDLKLFGIKSLQEIFYDRRLTHHLNPSRFKYAAGLAWNKKFESVGIVAIVLMALIISRLVYGPLDQKPVSGEFEGELLKIKNQAGQVIDRIEVGGHTAAIGQSTTTKHSLFTFSKNQSDYSIIWGESRSTQNLDGLLKKKKINQKDTDWIETLNYDLNFEHKPEVIDGVYLARKLIFVEEDVDIESPLLIAIVTHAHYFPGIISVRDPGNGTELNHFVNVGRIYDAIIFETEDEGKKLAFTGVSNAFDMAFVAVLNLDSITGHSPLNNEYSLFDYDLNESIEYILIPKTIVGQSVLSHRKFNIAERIRYFPESGVLEVFVTDYEQYSGDVVKLPASRSNVYYYFNEDLSLRGVGTSDGYDLTAEYLFSNGVIDQVPDYKYFENYQERLKYWDGSEFVSYGEYSEVD